MKIPLSGEALAAVGLVPSVLELDFGGVGVGATSKEHELVLTNASKKAVRTGNITITGGAASDFKILNDDGRRMVEPGSGLSIKMSAVPSALGLRRAELKVEADVQGPVISLRVEGLGVMLTWSPALLDFAVSKVGVQSERQTVALHNAGNRVLTVNAIDVLGDFIFQDLAPAFMTIQPNADKYFWVWFKPTKAGAQSGALRVHSDAADSPHLLTLAGSGFV